jgi:hypothetical protein
MVTGVIHQHRNECYPESLVERFSIGVDVDANGVDRHEKVGLDSKDPAGRLGPFRIRQVEQDGVVFCLSNLLREQVGEMSHHIVLGFPLDQTDSRHVSFV